jgi:predicted dehydrogenase
MALLLEHLRVGVTVTRGFALVGAGLFGQRHAQAYQRHPAADFVAVCDLDEARARRLAETYGARRWTTDLKSILGDPAVQAVSVATPDHAHRAVAVALAAAGKHILVEKPLATTVADAAAIVAAAEAAGVTLMVDFHNRLNPPMVAARQAIERGDIGVPTYVYARLSNTIAVPQDMLRWSSSSSALWFLGSHMVDIIGWILDDRPTRCYVVAREGVLKSKGIDAPDFHVATVEYAKGTVVVYEHAWILPRSHSTVKDLKIEILGSEGALYVDGSHNRTFELYTADKGTFPDMMVPPFGPRLTGFVLDAVAHFVDAVTEGKPVLATGREGLENTRIVAAMIDAANKGEAVELS